MMSRRGITMLVAAFLCVVANAADVINIGSYESTLDAGYTRFGEPAVTIEDENHVTVTNQYNISYSILGGENFAVEGVETTDSRGVVICTDAATGTYVEKYYGDVVMGRAGQVRIKVTATPKSGVGDVLTATYDLTINNLVATQKFVPSFSSALEDGHDGSVTLVTNRVKKGEDQYFLSAATSSLPIYTVTTTNAGGVTSDITSYYDVTIGYSGSDEIDYDPSKGTLGYAGVGDQWQTKTLEQINSEVAALGTPVGTLTYTFTPKAEYAGYYAEITRTIDVRLMSKTTDDLMPLRLSLSREQIKQVSVSNNAADGLPVIHVYKYGQSDITENNHYSYFTPIPSLLTEDGAALPVNSQQGNGSWGDFQLLYQIVEDSTYYDDCRYMPYHGVSLDDPAIVQPAGKPTGLSINDYMYQVAKPGLVKVAVYAVLQGTPDDNGYGAPLKAVYQPLLDDDDNPVTITQNWATYTAYSEPVYFYIDVMKRRPHLVFSPDPKDIVFVKGDKINIPTRFDVSAYIDDSHNGEEAFLLWGGEGGTDNFAYQFFISDRNANFIRLNDWPYENGKEAWEVAGGDIYSYRYRHIVLDDYSGYTGVAEIAVGDSIDMGDRFVVVTAENIETLKEAHPYILQGDYEWGIVYNSMKGYGNESWTMEFLATGQYNIPYTVRPWNHTRWDNSTEIGVTFRYSDDDYAATKIKLGYTFQVADKGQESFEEPEAKVVVPEWNNYDVTEYFDLTYEIYSDVSGTGTSINPLTGEVTIGSNATGDVVIKVTGTRKSVDINYANPEPAYYTIRIVDPATRAKWEVISTCKEVSPCVQHTTNHRFDDVSEANARMHFLTAGIIYGGTVIEGVPGITMTVGTPTTDVNNSEDWTTVATAESTPKCCAHETQSVIVKSTAVLQLDDDGIPSHGAFYQFNPTVNGYLTIDAKFYKNNTIVLMTRNSSGEYLEEVFSNSGDKTVVYPKATYDADGNLLGDYTFRKPLIAGETYYLYDITEGGNLNLHGFSYQPAFIYDRNTTLAQSKAPLQASLFMNGLSSKLPDLYDGTNQQVTFAVSDAHGVGVTVADYLEVGADGALDPQQMTLDEENNIFKLRVTATVKSSDYTLGDCVNRTTCYDVQIIDIPTFAIADEKGYGMQNIQNGTEVTTTNISTDITMTFGGWSDSDNKYFNVNPDKARTDTWEYKSKAGFGSRIGSELDDNDPYYNRTIDGFGYFNAAKQNPVDEQNAAAVNSGEVYTFGSGTDYEQADKRYNTTYKLPCRGAFLKFEPRESGVLMVYLVQNGSVDFHYGTQSIGSSYQLRWRPLYITDETGRPVTMVNDFGNVSKYLPTGDDATHAGSFTLGLSRCNKHEAAIESAWEYDKAVEEGSENIMAGCSFDWSSFRGTQEDRLHLFAAWPDKGERESIIRLSTGGFALPHKAYVRYAFHVKAGKTYFVFQPGSKFEFGGFSFVPEGYPDNCKYAINSKPGALVCNTSNQEKNYSGASANVEDLTFTWERAENFNALKENIVVTVNDRRKSELTSAEDKDVLKPRAFEKDKWEGVCLPFSVSTQEAKRVFGDDYAVVTCDGLTEDDVLHFVRHANSYMEAGRPYLVKPSKNGTMSFRNVTIEGDMDLTTLAGDTKLVTDPSRFDVDIDNGEYTFKGIYMRETMPKLSYFAKDDGLYRYSEDTKIGGYRAYFRKNTTASAGAKAMTFYVEDLYDMNEEGDMPTGVLLIEDDKVSVVAADVDTYNVNGQKIGSGADAINNAPHGVYIVNGRKLVK